MRRSDFASVQKAYSLYSCVRRWLIWSPSSSRDLSSSPPVGVGLNVCMTNVAMGVEVRAQADSRSAFQMRKNNEIESTTAESDAGLSLWNKIIHTIRMVLYSLCGAHSGLPQLNISMLIIKVRSNMINRNNESLTYIMQSDVYVVLTLFNTS